VAYICSLWLLQDITPPSVIAWLKHPVKRVHILLDRKGKTLSHAYVEMPDEDAARASLRTAQNSVLGKGKRARGVTVTRSSQEELMKALFPSWQGPFDGCRPSLAGLSNEQVVSALEHGLVSEAELKALLHLIRSPDVSIFSADTSTPELNSSFPVPLSQGSLTPILLPNQHALQIPGGPRQQTFLVQCGEGFVVW
jgi:hypothetical protein